MWLLQRLHRDSIIFVSPNLSENFSEPWINQKYLSALFVMAFYLVNIQCSPKIMQARSGARSSCNARTRKPVQEVKKGVLLHKNFSQ